MPWKICLLSWRAEQGDPHKSYSGCCSPVWAVARGLNASAFLNFLHFFQAVLQDGVLSLELKIATKQLSLKHQGKPIAVIWPHAMERHLVQLKPLGPHFWWQKKKELCTWDFLMDFCCLHCEYWSTSSFPLQPSCLPSGRHFSMSSSPFGKSNGVSEEHEHPSFPPTSYLPSLSVGSP